MLYNPPAFRLEEIAVLHTHIEQTGLAIVTTNGPQGPIASHLPLLIDRERGALGTLIGHMARANTHWQEGDLTRDALAVFSGVDAYISPSWYASKQEHGRVVPTWNYAVVHARGRLEVFDDAERLREVVSRLTDRHESRRNEPWAVSDAPERFVESQLKGIVGVQLEISHIEGKHKMSQNRPDKDVAGVIDGLGAEGHIEMQALVRAAAAKE